MAAKLCLKFLSYANFSGWESFQCSLSDFFESDYSFIYKKYTAYHNYIIITELIINDFGAFGSYEHQKG